ncbi:MAG TPA: serine/threonine-protein kinase [Actinospica sp.]|jgi:serine/threonine protein kinase|nr:serine/threonine-protein kinase [Actinospica sp.]
MSSTPMPGSPQAVFADLAASLGVTELVPIAQGGQKFVLRALHAGRHVAVKALLVPPGPAYAVALERATRETDVLRAVDSPHVVRLLSNLKELHYGGVLPYGVAWIEELLDGEDLDKLLGTPWPPAEAALLLTHLSEALAALHDAGYVHRDLNPVNVRRRTDGTYCVMDPGLAYRLGEPDPADAHCVGTKGYLSPEHTRGTMVLPPSDVYCAGILTHHALTGTAELDAPLPPDTPEPLARIVARCLHPTPAQRYPDGAALRAALGTLPAALTTKAPATIPPTRVPDLKYVAHDDEFVDVHGAFGTRRLAVESISKDQTPFAIRLSPYTLAVTPGVTFSARTIELDDGDRFTNSFELTVDTKRARLNVHSATSGFHLPGVLEAAPTTIAAVTGSFSFISDDIDYEPAEFCLDFCARDGKTVSLPTITKPALIVGQDGTAQLRQLAAHGTLRIGARTHTWTGSKLPAPVEGLTIYGAANCHVEYTKAKRVALLRAVDRHTNRTPIADADTIDLVITHNVVSSLHPGGGADLFEASFILRGTAKTLADVRPGDKVEILTIDDLHAADIESGFSIGPSAAAAGRGDALAGYDDSLGLSPFLPGARYARTLISLTDDVLRVRVLDGAPLTHDFQGVSCSETARILEADGLDPEATHHLDGGQSAKLAYRHGRAPTVLGSMHYLLWPKQDEGPFLWRGHQGRLLRSALTVSTR